MGRLGALQMTDEMKCDYCDKPATLHLDEGNICAGCLKKVCAEALELLVADGEFVRCGVDLVTGEPLYQCVERAIRN
jgi:hypothetical protein